MSQNHNFVSPLRYPGGKAGIKDFLIKIIVENNIGGGTHVEPYAGGAGAALSLMMQDYIYQIYLNDKDRFIYSFWYSVIHDTDRLCQAIHSKRASVAEWKRQHKLLNDKYYEQNGDPLDVGLTGFYLNRTTRSGILNSGPIGGLKQTGNYKVGARFNKADLIKRIENIALFKSRIMLYNMDAVDFLKKLFDDFILNDQRLLVYLDPPYDIVGKDIYRHFYVKKDHEDLSNFLKSATNFKWLLSYDDTKLIKELYGNREIGLLKKNYFINKAKVGKELFISSDNLVLPDEFRMSENQSYKFNKVRVSL
ncbi:MAG: DNA adenine methylase [Bacteroidetes bacterium]|nr:DNA adenine methylase [Bacteroidota bacterium]